jgi:hypothetical protein
MAVTAFQEYLSKVKDDYRRGIATEHTYRSALEKLVETLAPGVDASNDPKHIACGAPDFIVERHKVPLGYMETKDVGDNLDKVEKTDQLKRYFKALNNLILTNYLEFRWYVRGVMRLKVSIADAGTRRLIPNAEGISLAEHLFSQFIQTETPTVTSAKELATRLAEQTHLVRDLIVNALKSNEEAEHAALDKQYQTFREFLLPELKPEEFADLYAQTMAYGLFAAKLSAPENAPFNRAAAYQYLTANKFLRRLFLDVGEELDGTVIAPFLDDIASLLAHADLSKIQADLFKRTRSEDPVVHFYETFLSVYDPKMRESRGVYYTPEPVVQFIVNSVNWLLKNRFGRDWGLADSNVKILDPATGTATFLYYVIQSIHAEIIGRSQGGTWPEKSKEMLRRVFGFELLMAPYVVSHLKLDLLMQELDAPLTKNERLQIFLTNTLEPGVTRAETLERLDYYIAEEASQAAHVKKQEDIMVVLGNPPYSVHSENASVDAQGNLNFIGKLLREYYFVDGAPLGERNPKSLQDDYVKFIRFGEWRIQQTGYGILAFITNHGYLDNPTFRGMRQHLMNTFNEIYVLDLHGNSNKKERTPDGGKDENVFDIQQGVAVLLAIKDPAPNQPQELPLLASVKHASLWGLREEKYTFLQARDVAREDWTDLQPIRPYYLFSPMNTDLQSEYETGWNISDFISINSSCMNTARDGLVIDVNKDTLINRIKSIYEPQKDTRQLEEIFGIVNTGWWNFEKARKDLQKTTDWPKLVTKCLYRPFDQRWLFHHQSFIDRPRTEVNSHLFHENLSFVTTRQTKEPFAVIATNLICGQHKIAAVYDRSYFFPLYLYTTPEETAGTLFAQSETTRKPNLAPKFIEAISEKLRMKFIPDGKGDLKATFGPEDVFHYAYAVFHSPAYRERYAEFLKIDFPRLPLTSDRKLFAKLIGKGEELVALHLLKSPKLYDFITSYPVSGKNVVEKVQYAKGNVWINNSQYFGGVPEDVWEFKVGGYQVCEKWLKDRKERTLSGEDIAHYQRMVVALNETIRLMKEIDKTIPAWPME